ncbi:hypothetical protein MUK42_33086 [Musa troglodytarum]|uniref:Uncharacterized protein n=1 Tax=Musa troglodytarum TaxID=320322 RepID=A0A9E7KS17_9LILI|nr:hypothetical protein MUK42_33086 [Musa troglodytarum]
MMEDATESFRTEAFEQLVRAGSVTRRMVRSRQEKEEGYGFVHPTFASSMLKANALVLGEAAHKIPTTCRTENISSVGAYPITVVVVSTITSKNSNDGWISIGCGWGFRSSQ